LSGQFNRANFQEAGERFSLSANVGVWPPARDLSESPATAMHEQRSALARPTPACFATLLRPGTGALQMPGETLAPGEENRCCQNHFSMDDQGKSGGERAAVQTLRAGRRCFPNTPSGPA